MNANVTEAIKFQIKRKGKALAQLNEDLSESYARVSAILQAAEDRKSVINTIMELQDSLNEVPLPHIWTTRKEMELMLLLDSLFNRHMRAFMLESRDIVHELQEINRNKPSFFDGTES